MKLCDLLKWRLSLRVLELFSASSSLPKAENLLERTSIYSSELTCPLP
jgi:hypothetical protein